MKPQSEPRLSLDRDPEGQEAVAVRQRSSRSASRIASILCGIGFGIGGPLVLIDLDVYSVLYWVGALLMVAGFMGTGVLIVERFARWAWGTDGELDEWQRQMRNRAFQVAFRVMLAGVVFAMGLALATTIATRGEWVLTHDKAMQVLLWASLILFTLPAAVLAWLEPAPPAEPATDAAGRQA